MPSPPQGEQVVEASSTEGPVSLIDQGGNSAQVAALCMSIKVWQRVAQQACAEQSIS